MCPSFKSAYNIYTCKIYSIKSNVKKENCLGQKWPQCFLFIFLMQNISFFLFSFRKEYIWLWQVLWDSTSNHCIKQLKDRNYVLITYHHMPLKHHGEVCKWIFTLSSRLAQRPKCSYGLSGPGNTTDSSHLIWSILHLFSYSKSNKKPRSKAPKLTRGTLEI